MGENKGSFIITLIVMFILFLSWIAIVFNLGGRFYKGELILLVLFLLVSLKLTFGSNQWRGLIKFYSLIWVNFLFIYFMRFSIKEVVLPFAVSFIGWLVAIVKLDSDDFEEGDWGEGESLEVKKEFSPGKYVASKTGKKFHAPKCDWAKKIKKDNQIWFESKEEAETENLKACDCVN
ncbi:hypothetical protein KY332_02735 [Candidatus Woesearchaeota archaeon]|nr:hypothetical protein [Candidatus Woesearchaeota archaeon]